jgi:hypothetical protein
MGFLDKLRGKKDSSFAAKEIKDHHQQQQQSTTGKQNTSAASSGRRIKRYTSEGKPIYE